MECNNGARQPQAPQHPLGLMALEPRWMFDGAAFVDAAHAAPDAAAKGLIPDAPASVQVRAADPSKDGGKKEVVFIDTSVADYKTLEAAVKPGIEIEEVDGTQSGLAQIAKWAESHTGYDSISILSHGAEASVRIGTDTLTDAKLSDATVQAELAEIGHSLNDGADLLLYGCDVAKGDDGQQFITDLAAAIGADVAASGNVTGMDGDWTLEKATGSVAAGQMDAVILATFAHDLAFPLSITNMPTSGSCTFFAVTVDSAGCVYATGQFTGVINFNSGAGTATLDQAVGSAIVEKLNADGTLAWVKQFGTSNSIGNAISVDSSGNVFVAGTSGGTSSFGGVTLTNAGGNDAFAMKLNSDGTTAWAVDLGGTGADVGTGIAVDPVGKVTVTGSFSGTAGFGGTNLISAGGTDIFVTQLNADGTTAWAESIGGSSNDAATALALNSTGANVFVTGSFSGANVDFDPGAGTYNISTNGNTDIFVLKLAADGSFVWADRMGGSNGETGYGIAVDSNGGVYTTGAFNGTTAVDFNPGAGTFNLSGGSNTSFVQKLNSDGTLAWANALGGSAAFGKAIAVDGSGKVHVAGYFQNSGDFDPGAGVNTLTSAGSADIFVETFNADGTFGWVNQTGGIYAGDYGYGIAVDAAGKIYVSGVFQGAIDLNPGAGVSTGYSTNLSNGFVQKLNADGSFVWAYAPKSGGTADASSVSIDPSNNIFVGGNFTGLVDFDLTNPGTDIFSSYGGYSVYLEKLNSDATVAWTKLLGAGASSVALSGIITDSAGNFYAMGSFTGTGDFDPGVGTINLTGNNNAYVAKLDPNGNAIWAKTYGAYSAIDVAVDASSNVFISGQYIGTKDLDPGAGTQNLTSTGSGSYVLKLNPDGSFAWVTGTKTTNSSSPTKLALGPGGPFTARVFFRER